MQTNGAPARYGAAAQIFHWLSALLVGIGWLLGQFGDAFPKGPARETALFAHVSAGQIILALLLLRLAWRFVSPPPPDEPSPFGRTAEIAGKATHVLLYALLLAVVVTGVMTLFAGGKAMPLFGVAEIASPWAKDREFRHQMKEIHELAANSLIVLATIHAGAALAHYFVLRDRVLQRMLPWV